MPTYRTSEQFVVVQHVTVELNQTFEKAKAAALIPALNPQIAAHLAAGEIALTNEALEVGPELAIFGSLNHGGLLRISGQPRKAIQYSIGNPLTASKMTRLAISAALMRLFEYCCMKQRVGPRSSNTTSHHHPWPIRRCRSNCRRSRIGLGIE